MEINRTVTRCETLLLIIIIRDYSCGQLHRPPSVVIRRSLGLDSDPPDPESRSSPAGEDIEVRKWGKFACIFLKIQRGSVLVPMLARMYKKRLAGYSALGYVVAEGPRT